MQWRGVRRLSVNFCANRFFSQANGPIATKLAHDGLQVSVHPGCAQGQGQRLRDTRTFLNLGMSYSVVDGLVLNVYYTFHILYATCAITVFESTYRYFSVLARCGHVWSIFDAPPSKGSY